MSDGTIIILKGYILGVNSIVVIYDSIGFICNWYMTRNYACLDHEEDMGSMQGA